LVGQGGRAEYFAYLKRTGQVKSASVDVATKKELAKLRNEMLADFMGQRFNDRAWLEELAEQEPSLFGAFVRDWLKLLANLITGLKGKVGATGAKNVDRYIAQLEEAKGIAKEVAIAWAEQNPELVGKSGLEDTLDLEAQLSWKAVPGTVNGYVAWHDGGRRCWGSA
jgi:hypothetical protein